MVSQALGETIPAHNEHAVSVCLPTWDANVKYEEGDAATMSALKGGYPRFMFHPLVKQLFDHFERKFARSDEGCMVFPSSRAASEAREFMKTFILAHPETYDVSMATRIRIAEFAIQPIFQDISLAAATDPSTHLQRTIFVHSLLYPTPARAVAKMFWQHCGEGISSRFAGYCLRVMGFNRQSRVDFFNTSAIGDRFAAPGYRIQDQSEALRNANQTAENAASNLFLEERFGRNMDLTFAPQAKVMLRQRIAGVLADNSDTDEAAASSAHATVESLREKGLDESHVLLFPCGMSAIYNAFRVVRRIKPGLKTVQFGFPYTDTLKIQEKIGAGCIFLGNGSKSDLDHLESLLTSGKEKVAALFCEFPSNPLLKSADLRRIRSLATKFDFLVVVDETIGNFYNVDVLPCADIVVSSLTKIFSGDCNVMGGSAVMNPMSPKFREIKEAFDVLYEDNVWEEDAIFLERNSRNFVSRTMKINATAAKVASFLHNHPKVEQVHYPLFSDHEIYSSYLRPGGGYGGLFSVILKDEGSAKRFYDNIDADKGPSLGTNFTLISPYVILAHYTELDWAERFGVARRLLRVSVGLENEDALLKKFSDALEFA
ncbi:hypothetical protein HDU82_006196 [Entophlyctis luteolus]|nr:hypothetical protein HDU82_006196 [Entophlyctis luteolus]